jgi:hypothetical protein
LFRRSTLSKVRDYAVWLGISITCISLCSRSRRLPSHRNLVTPISQAHGNKSTSHQRSNSPLRTPILYASTDADCALRSRLPGYPQHSKDGCPRLNRHPRREQSVCAIQVGAIGYVGFCPIIRNTSNYLLGESAVGKVC